MGKKKYIYIYTCRYKIRRIEELKKKLKPNLNNIWHLTSCTAESCHYHSTSTDQGTSPEWSKLQNQWKFTLSTGKQGRNKSNPAMQGHKSWASTTEQVTQCRSGNRNPDSHSRAGGGDAREGKAAWGTLQGLHWKLGDTYWEHEMKFKLSFLLLDFPYRFCLLPRVTRLALAGKLTLCSTSCLLPTAQ